MLGDNMSSYRLFFMVLLMASLYFACTLSCSRYDNLPDDEDGGYQETDKGQVSCNPECPTRSDCRDLDGIGKPECVFPSGKLACADDSHCPKHASCSEAETCEYNSCVCFADDDCYAEGINRICVTEDGLCGTCVEADSYECTNDSDCVIAIRYNKCCALPIARNKSAVDEKLCLSEYPIASPTPDECIVNCYNTDHCWPLPDEPIEVSCSRRGICILEPLPGQ